jgi:hypothetical protein
MTATNKDTIYVDVDDEITNIIEKVRGSDKKIVALVLPKRAAVLQSIVNMKLLKRSAESQHKNIVLITSETGLLPLAGAVGLHVAKNLQSKPVIPAGPEAADATIPEVSEDEIEAEPEVDETKTVGELAGASAVASAIDDEDEPIELDNSTPEATAPALAAKGSKTPKAAKNKKFKVPNFEKFRVLLILGGLGIVLLIVGIYMAVFVMPKATITIKTDSTTVNSNIPFTASTATTEFNQSQAIIPAVRKETKKTQSQTVPATGQKNNGTKATGSVSMTTKVCGSFSSPSPVPSGTGISANGLTYITQATVTFSPDTISGSCINFKSNSASITAQNGGANYNTGSISFTVAGRSDVSATGSAAGGTDNIIKVVSQSDVDSAKQKLTANNEETARAELQKTLQAAGMQEILETFNTSDAVVTTTPNVGDQADNVAVTSVVTYSMLGVNKANLQKLVSDSAAKQIDTSKQSILDDGISSATYIVQGDKNAAQVKITVQSEVKAGPQLDAEGIKKEVAGKKKGDTISIIESRPAIKDVTVKYSPFWVSKTPSKPSKIVIIFDQQNAKP